MSGTAVDAAARNADRAVMLLRTYPTDIIETVDDLMVAILRVDERIRPEDVGGKAAVDAAKACALRLMETAAWMRKEASDLDQDIDQADAGAEVQT